MKKLFQGRCNNQKGQSTIEFILSFAFSVSLLFLLLRLALNYTEGYMIHYANFMASRAYLTYENNSNNPLGGEGGAATLAETVLNKIYPIFDGEFSVMSPRQDSGHRNVFVGTRADFSRRFSVPMIVGTADELNLVSESFLGRIPNKAECLERVCAAYAALGVGNCGLNEAQHLTLADNGC